MGKRETSLSDALVAKTVFGLKTLTKRQSVSDVAETLGYTYSYVYQVLKGVLLPGAPLAQKVDEMLNGKRQYPPTLPVRFESEAEKNLVRDRLTNDERAQLLLEKARTSDE